MGSSSLLVCCLLQLLLYSNYHHLLPIPSCLRYFWLLFSSWLYLQFHALTMMIPVKKKPHFMQPHINYASVHTGPQLMATQTSPAPISRMFSQTEVFLETGNSYLVTSRF